jgi:hypothetical protein
MTGSGNDVPLTILGGGEKAGGTNRGWCEFVYIVLFEV